MNKSQTNECILILIILMKCQVPSTLHTQLLEISRCTDLAKEKGDNGMGRGTVLQFGLRNGNTNVILTNTHVFSYIYSTYMLIQMQLLRLYILYICTYSLITDSTWSFHHIYISFQPIRQTGGLPSELGEWWSGCLLGVTTNQPVTGGEILGLLGDYHPLSRIFFAPWTYGILGTITNFFPIF